MTMVHHSDEASSPDHLQRKLSNRHLQLIAIGGAIGTGLFMGSGKTISLAGPSILVIYMLIGGNKRTTEPAVTLIISLYSSRAIAT
ncbi:amino acid permease family protein, partial [Acinetobacter baumannii 940793]